MRMCDWHGVSHRTRPGVLGNSQTGEVRDVDLCLEAIDTLQKNLKRDGGSTSMYRYAHREEEPNHFMFDMMEW